MAQIVPSIAWMRQKFDEFNQKYFGNRIPLPMLKVEPMRNKWGNYDPKVNYNIFNRKLVWDKKSSNRGVLTLTSAYKRDERDVCTTLLHEMGHAYVSWVMGLWPKNLHGAEFMSALRNATADGWNITAETELTANDTLNIGQNDETQRAILCIIFKPSGTNYKYWICRALPENMTQIKEAASRIPGVAEVSFYEIMSNAFIHVKSDPNELFGWGGMTIDEAARNTAIYCGISTKEILEGLRRINV